MEAIRIEVPEEITQTRNMILRGYVAKYPLHNDEVYFIVCADHEKKGEYLDDFGMVTKLMSKIMYFYTKDEAQDYFEIWKMNKIRELAEFI